MAQPDSECSHARQRYHNWMVYSHDTDWQKLGCFCSRCAARTVMSAEDYIQVLAAANRATTFARRKVSRR